MAWSDQLFIYCERGHDPGFWAEPVNAVTNGAFLLAAVAASAQMLVRDRAAATGPRHAPSTRAEQAVLWALILLVAIIGIGSFLFHTYATRWAALADVAPITLFMLAYLAYALRVFLALGWLAVGLLLAAFLASGSLIAAIPCPEALQLPVAARGSERPPCLNGSLAYLPALLSLWAVGLLAARRGLAAGRTLMLAGTVFLVSLTLRTIDRDVCAGITLLGHTLGTHAGWHVLNGLTLYLLLTAAINQPRATDRGSS